MKLVKNGDGIVLPGGEPVLLELIVKQSGVQLKSPLPPSEICKLLSNLSIDIMYAHFQPKEISKIETPM